MKKNMKIENLEEMVTGDVTIKNELHNLIIVPKNKEFKIGKIYNAPIQNQCTEVFDVYGTLEDLVLNIFYYRIDIYKYQIIEPSAILDIINNIKIYQVKTLDIEDLFSESDYSGIIGSCKVKILKEYSWENIKNYFSNELKIQCELIDIVLKKFSYKTIIESDIQYVKNILHNLNNYEEIYINLCEYILNNCLKSIKKLDIKEHSKRYLNKKIRKQIEFLNKEKKINKINKVVACTNSEY